MSNKAWSDREIPCDPGLRAFNRQDLLRRAPLGQFTLVLAGRRGNRGARLAPGTARTCGSAGRQAPFRPLDTRLTAAIMLRLPERAAWRTSPDQEYPTERSETEVEGSVEVGPPVCREAFSMPSW